MRGRRDSMFVCRQRSNVHLLLHKKIKIKSSLQDLAVWCFTTGHLPNVNSSSEYHQREALLPNIRKCYVTWGFNRRTNRSLTRLAQLLQPLFVTILFYCFQEMTKAIIKYILLKYYRVSLSSNSKISTKTNKGKQAQWGCNFARCKQIYFSKNRVTQFSQGNLPYE